MLPYLILPINLALSSLCLSYLNVRLLQYSSTGSSFILICNVLFLYFLAPAAGGCRNQESGTSDDARTQRHHRRTSTRPYLLIVLTSLPCLLTYQLFSLLSSYLLNLLTRRAHRAACCLICSCTYLSDLLNFLAIFTLLHHIPN